MTAIFTLIAKALFAFYPNKTGDRTKDLKAFTIEIRDELAEKLRFDGECSRSANVLAKI